MAVFQLIAPTTALVNTSDTGFEARSFRVTSNQTITLSASLLANAETVSVDRYNSDGTWSTAYANQIPFQLTALNPMAIVPGAGLYRVGKSATAGACCVDATY